ncbi:hypothetical protein Pgy4_37756, partial [Pseudomonas savastanoi pv. glycinea str. race 4]
NDKGRYTRSTNTRANFNYIRLLLRIKTKLYMRGAYADTQCLDPGARCITQAYD